jgi:multidrug resistance efflux pump
MAKPGDMVKRGEPLFYIEAADMVQAQNDFLTALASINKAKSRVTITEIIEKQNRTLYESKAGALRDFQTATADLAQARADLRTAESALEAARNRLIILGKTDAEIAGVPGAGQDQLRDADLCAAVRHRRAAQDRTGPVRQLHQHRRCRSGLHDRRSLDRVARRLCSRKRGCLSRRLLVMVAFAAFLGLGYAAFLTLNIEAYPDPAPPIIEIIAQQQGQSPEEVERYITIPIEIAVASTPG